MAVDRNDDVMAMVEEELRKNPEIPNEELRGKAEKIDADVAELSARQFNARYPLQVKRRLKAEQEEEAAEPEGGEDEMGGDEEEFRSVAREVLLDFARAVAGAEDRAEMIDVLANVDEYVDRVVQRS